MAKNSIYNIIIIILEIKLVLEHMYYLVHIYLFIYVFITRQAPFQKQLLLILFQMLNISRIDDIYKFTLGSRTF